MAREVGIEIHVVIQSLTVHADLCTHRKYSTDAFYEAPAVGLATLLLWAFGTYAPTCRNEVAPISTSPTLQPQTVVGVESAKEELEGDESNPVPNTILLDRPTDDELVQRFIRQGHRMKAQISGIGNLCDHDGPRQILRQSCKLVSTLECWAVSSAWHDLLKRLEIMIADN